MTTQQKKTNEKFLNKVIMITETYIYPYAQERYDIIDGKMYGTKRGIKVLKEITTKDFHHKLVVKK